MQVKVSLTYFRYAAYYNCFALRIAFLNVVSSFAGFSASQTLSLTCLLELT